MSLAHAILGFLQREAQSGYDLKNKHFDKSVAHFWPADQTQIYKTLDKLVEQGLAKSQLELQEIRPNRKVYAITKKGKQELLKWLKEPATHQAYRDPLLIQLFFGEFVTDDDLLSVLSAEKQTHETSLAQLRSIPIPALAKCKSREELLARLTLELGLKIKEAHIEWIDLASKSILSFSKRQKSKG